MIIEVNVGHNISKERGVLLVITVVKMLSVLSRRISFGKFSLRTLSTLPKISNVKELFRNRLERAQEDALGLDRAEKQHKRGKLSARERY